MKLYLYNKNNLEQFMVVYGEVEGSNSVWLDEGGVMHLPAFIEASSKPDLSEKLMEEASILAPDTESRLAALEEAVASLIYGGEIYNAQ